MLFIQVLQVAALCGVVSASTTTTVESSCVINYDLSSGIMEILQAMFDNNYNILQTELALVRNQMNNSIIAVPTPGAWSEEWAREVYNSSTGVVTNGLYQAIDFIQWADSSGFNLLYGLSLNTAGVLAPYTGVAPQLTGAALAACTTYNCNSMMYYYYINENGKPTGNSYKQNAYNTPTRPVFWPNIVYQGGVIYNHYYTSNAKTTLLALTFPYWSQVHSATYTEYKVACSDIVMALLDDKIAAINEGGASTVGYVMTTANPVGLLLASSTGYATNMTTYAISNPNAVISSTAQYILSENIVTNTQGYVESLGCYLNVQFFTYGAANPILITAPPSANLPSASTQDVYPVTGIQWTVVSCNIQDPPTTAYTTSDDISSSSTAQALTAMVAIIFIIAVLALFAGVYSFFFAAKTVATSAAPSNKPAATGATEMTSSPMSNIA